MAELTRPPKTVREWLQTVHSRGGVDAEWAHEILRDDRYGGRKLSKTLDEPRAIVPAPTGDAI